MEPFGDHESESNLKLLTMKYRIPSILLAIFGATAIAFSLRHGTLGLVTPETSTSSNSPVPVVMEPSVEHMTSDAKASFDWSQIESSDFPTYISNLRRISCPEETIRDVVIADLNKLYDTQIAASPNERTRILEAESSTVKLLLGIEYSRKSETAENAHPDSVTWVKTAGLEAKADLIDNCLRRSAALRSNIIDASGKTDLSEEQSARLEAIENEEQRQLDAILSPEERMEYDLQNTGLGSEAKDLAELFDLGDAAYKDVFSGLRQLDSFAKAEPGDAVAQANLDIAVALLRKNFGPDVAEGLIASKEQGFMQFASGIKAKNLPPSQILALWRSLPGSKIASR